MTTKTQVNFRPLNDRVLIKRNEAEASSGGIILPDSAKKKQEIATVIATGPGKRKDDGALESMEIKAGDSVLLDRYAGQEVTLDGEEYLIVRQDDIIAIVE